MPAPTPQREEPPGQRAGGTDPPSALADGPVPLASVATAILPPAGSDAAWQAALTRRICLHCGTELGVSWQEKDGPFCCQGCRAVFLLIHRSGLGRFYNLSNRKQAPPASLRTGSLAWLDRLVAEQGPETATGTFHLSLDIQGVHCAACVWLLEELFRRHQGGLDLIINPSLGRVDLSWDATRGDLKAYLGEVEKFGYRFGPARKTTSRHSRRLMVRMAVCIAVAVNVMMFSLSFYFGLAPRDGALYGFFGAVSCGLATLAVAIGGPVFWRGAVAGLKQRVVHLDLPISLGMVLAYLGSVYGYALHGPEEAYFDSLTVFVALMLVGRWAQEHILERNRHSLLESAGVDGLTVKRQRAGRIQAIAATEIRQGDELWIAPGDLVPCDGILLRKTAEIALDWITGESEVRTCNPGQTLPAGVINNGRQGFPLTASQDFEDSRLRELLRTGPAGRSLAPTPHSRWWSRVATVYVMAVLALALGGFLWWMGQDGRRAVEVTVAILVVTCPCALGLATPLAEELIHAALRRRGVFLCRSRFLEKAQDVRKVLWDKTGTLTLGRLVLTEESRKQLWGLEAADKECLWRMTARSNHPVSRCLAEAATSQNRPPTQPESRPISGPNSCEGVTEFAGRGLACRFRGRNYRLGCSDFATGDPKDLAGGSPPTPGHGGESPVNFDSATVFSVDGFPVASFRFREEYRPDAVSELARLRRSGYDLHLLSGDAEPKVQQAARALGIAPTKARGGLSPEAKAERVVALDCHDTLMVGDGLNDSPGFQAAYCAATPAIDRPVLPGKADFFFLGDGIAAVGQALRAAHRLRQVVRSNLTVAAIYNLVAVALCLAGWVGPVAAAILMPLSSVTVVTLTAWRLTGRRLAWMS